MAALRCASCGADVSPFADRCRRCGADPRVAIIELGGDGGTPSSGDARGGAGPFGRLRRWRPIIAAALAVWVAVALVASLAGGDDGGVDETTGEPVPDSPATTVPRRPSSTTATTAGPALQPLALGEATGLHVVAAAPGSLIDVDLDTGERVEHLFPGVVRAAIPAGLVALHAGDLVWQPFPLTSSPPVIVASDLGGIGGMWLLEDASGVWVAEARADRGAAPMELRLLALDGSGVRATVSIPGDVPSVGASGGLLVVGAGGRSYTIDVRGAIADLGSGLVIAAGGGYAVLRHCDGELRCGAVRLALATGEATPLSGLPETMGSRLGGAWIGPTGVVVASVFGPDGGLFVSGPAGTTASGDTRQPVEFANVGAFSADGRWLLAGGNGSVWVGPAAGGLGTRFELGGGYADGAVLLLDGPVA